MDKVKQEREIAKIRKDLYKFTHENVMERLGMAESLIKLRYELGKKLIGLKSTSSTKRFEEQLEIIKRRYGIKTR